MPARRSDHAGGPGTAGDGFRIPDPRPADYRECDDPAEPGRRRFVAARNARTDTGGTPR